MRWKLRVAEFYHLQQAAREEVAVTELTPDTDLRDIFPVSKRRKTALPAHEFLHQHRKAVIDKVAQWTGAQRPLIKTLIDTIEKRAGELDLRADKTRSAEHLAEVTAYATALVMTYRQRKNSFSRKKSSRVYRFPVLGEPGDRFMFKIFLRPGT